MPSLFCGSKPHIYLKALANCTFFFSSHNAFQALFLTFGNKVVNFCRKKLTILSFFHNVVFLIWYADFLCLIWLLLPPLPHLMSSIILCKILNFLHLRVMKIRVVLLSHSIYCAVIVLIALRWSSSYFGHILFWLLACCIFLLVNCISFILKKYAFVFSVSFGHWLVWGASLCWENSQTIYE